MFTVTPYPQVRPGLARWPLPGPVLSADLEFFFLRSRLGLLKMPPTATVGFSPLFSGYKVLPSPSLSQTEAPPFSER